MNKIDFSILVPTLNRPHRMETLYKSIIDTSSNPCGIELFFYIDDTDKESIQFFNEIKSPLVKAIIGPKIVLSECWNRLAEKCTGDILMLAGDDIVFKTYMWDKIIKNKIDSIPDKIGFFYGDDRESGRWFFGTHGFVHRNWLEAVGRFVPPYFESGFNDIWLNNLAEKINRKYFCEIVIEHQHHSVNGDIFDSTYEKSQRLRNECHILYDSLENERIEDSKKLKHFIDNFPLMNKDDIKNNVGVCICNGPNNHPFIFNLLNTYESYFNTYIHNDGIYDDENMYCNSDELQYICKNKNIFCTRSNSPTGHHNLMNDFMYQYGRQYKWVVFLDADLEIHDQTWVEDVIELIYKNQYVSMIGGIINPYWDDRIKADALARMFTSYFIINSQDFFDVNGNMKRLNEQDFKNNQVNFNKNIFLDSGCMLLESMLLSEKKILDVDMFANKKIIHLNNDTKRIKKQNIYDATSNPIYYPKEIELEVTSRCNLRCVQCSQSWTPDELKKDLPDYILEQMKPALRKANNVSLHGIGEPLYSRNFWNIIDNINDNAYISFHSNMTIMTDTIADKLTDGKIKMIDISLDAATPETYLKIRGYDLNKVINNIRLLVERKKDKNINFPLLRMNMTLMKENIEEVCRFVELSQELEINCVHLWRMNDDLYPTEVKNDYFTFKYSDQNMNLYKYLFNEEIIKARKRAEELGVEFLLDSPLYEVEK